MFRPLTIIRELALNLSKVIFMLKNIRWIYVVIYHAVVQHAATQPHIGTMHCTKSCIYSQKVLLRMGEFVARNV